MTDGEFNASLRKGDSVEEISVDRAAELLAERRVKAPSKKPSASSRKRTTKKPGVKG